MRLQAHVNGRLCTCTAFHFLIGFSETNLLIGALTPCLTKKEARYERISLFCSFGFRDHIAASRSHGKALYQASLPNAQG